MENVYVDYVNGIYYLCFEDISNMSCELSKITKEGECNYSPFSY